MLRSSTGGRLFTALALESAVTIVSAVPALATPTGLNNIPTADVVPPGVLVLQAWTNFGSGLETSWAIGAKYGPAQHWEIGLDGGVSGPGSGGGPIFQAKYEVPLENGARLAIGAADVSSDREAHGEYFPYVVASVFPSAPGAETNYVLKADYVIPFGR